MMKALQKDKWEKKMRIFSVFVRVLGMLCLTVLTWFSSVNATPDSTYPFELTTSSTNLFKFKLSAAGDFMIDCGNGGTLSGDGVSGNTITRTGTSPVTYTCSWPSSTVQTVRFGGHATGYSTSSNTAAIRFNIDGSSDSNVKKVASISGSLGQIFGTVASPSTGQSQPRFYSTFWNAINLKGSIPSTLFDGIAGSPVTYMFYQTFYGCSGLTGSIPGNLFAGISGNKMDYMFYQTFAGCSGLTGYVPENLFAGISNNGAYSALQYVFDNTGLATSCPENGVQIETGFEYYFSGHVACLECPALPDGYVRMKNSCVACPIFTNVKEGAGSSGDYPEFLDTYSSGTDGCYMTLQYGGFGGNTDIMPAEEFLPGYNPNLDANQGYYSESKCFWNASDNAYTKCINLPINVYCRFGYIPTQQEINIASQIAELWGSDDPDDATRLRSLIDENISSTPYACHPVDAGYYSTSYENMKKLVEQQPEAETYIQMNVGTTVIDGLLYNFATGQQTTSISGEYAKCPYTHPYSEPAAKQKSECYANVTFETNGGSNIGTTRVYYGQDLSKLPKPTKAGYGFAGWYTDEDLSGTPLDSDSSINGNTTLYAKWGDLCVAGQYYSMEDGACTSCPTGYTTNGNNEMSIDECYRPCNSSDLPHASAVSGTMYYNGENNCKIVSCANGWQPQNNPFESVDLKIRKSGTYAKGVNSDDSDYCVVNGSWSNSSDQCSDENLADLNRWEFKTTFDYGTIYGTSTCISNKGTTRGESVPYYQHSSGDSYGQYCWCNLTKFVNSNGELQEFFMSPWQYEDDEDSNSYCKQNCPNRCANLFDAYYAGPFILGVKVFESFATELPKCKPMTYMITFNLNGGEFPAPVNVPTNYTVSANDVVHLPTPTRENYNFGGWYDNSALSGNPIANIQPGTYGDKTYFAKWVQNEYCCEPGYYLPANKTTCEPCDNANNNDDEDKEYYCPGGLFPMNETTVQGAIQCPTFTNETEGAYTLVEYTTFAPVGGDIGVADSIEDCAVSLLYGNKLEMFYTDTSSLTQDSNYNPDLPINTNNAQTSVYCVYNQITNAYNKCIPHFIIGSVCNKGYYITQEEYNIAKSVLTDDNSDNMLRNLLGDHGACHPAEPGYYTTLYDYTIDGLVENTTYTADTVSMGLYVGYIIPEQINGEQTKISDLYKKCPDEYPGSAPKSWKKADCYATLSFDSRGGDTINARQIHYAKGKDAGYTVVNLPTPTRKFNTFVGWYDNPEFRGSAITSDTVLSGNTTLYAKWSRDDFVCESGVWFHLGNNVKTCLMSEKPESKSFAIYQNGSTYYLNMTTKEVPVNEDTATKMKVYYEGREYCLYDESVSLD